MRPHCLLEKTLQGSHWGISAPYICILIDSVGVCLCVWFSVYLQARMYPDFVGCFWILCSLSSKVNLKVMIIQQHFLPCLGFLFLFFSPFLLQ